MQIEQEFTPEAAWRSVGEVLKILQGVEPIDEGSDVPVSKQRERNELRRDVVAGRLYQIIRKLDTAGYPNQACKLRKLLWIVSDDDLADRAVFERLVALYKDRGETFEVRREHSLYVAGGSS